MDTRWRIKPVVTSLDLVSCPECKVVARIEWRDRVDSTDGPLEIAKIRCLQGHWFLMPMEELVKR